jgi:hypothetical protein
MVRCAATQVTGGVPAADMGAEAKTGGKTRVKADATTSGTADGAEAATCAARKRQAGGVAGV